MAKNKIYPMLKVLLKSSGTGFNAMPGLGSHKSPLKTPGRGINHQIVMRMSFPYFFKSTHGIEK